MYGPTFINLRLPTRPPRPKLDWESLGAATSTSTTTASANLLERTREVVFAVVPPLQVSPPPLPEGVEDVVSTHLGLCLRQSSPIW